MNKNILEWLEETSKKFPDKIAFEDVENSITFSEVESTAKHIASELVKHTEVRKPVIVISSRKVLTPAVFLSVVYAGCFYAPLDVTAPIYRLNKIIENTKPSLILCDKENYEFAKSLEFDGEILIAEDLMNTDIDETALSKVREQSTNKDPLYIIFTSGSSGTPKGVQTAHISVMTYINAYSKVMKIDENDVFGNQSPLDYIAAIRDIYLPLKHGASTFIIPKQYFSTPAALFDVLNERKITAVGWSVSALTLPTKLGAFEHTKPMYLKKICFSGSVMPCSCLKIWQEQLPDTLFVNQYGPTEATASCTYYVVENKVEDTDVLPIGQPYENYEIFLLNDDNTETEKGEIGEICVRGNGVTMGYYNSPELTARSYIQYPFSDEKEIVYKTGDLGRIREDGLLEFHGRKDRQIKHLGHRVELGEIEEAVKAIESVEECAVLYNKPKEQICLFYSGEATAKDIAKHLRATLPGFMVPRKFDNLSELPHLPNGKIDMQEINKKYILEA